MSVRSARTSTESSQPLAVGGAVNKDRSSCSFVSRRASRRIWSASPSRFTFVYEPRAPKPVSVEYDTAPSTRCVGPSITDTLIVASSGLPAVSMAACTLEK